MSTRTVPVAVVRRVATNTLGRLACEYDHPDEDGHDHAECVIDAESYAADLLLRLVFAATNADDTTLLERLTDFTDAIEPEDAATQTLA
jgi:hypothetical protein